MRLPGSMTRANSARAHAPRSSMHIPFRDAKKAAAPVRNKSARQASAFRFGSALFAARECAGCFSYSYMHQPIVERPAACRSYARDHPAGVAARPVPFVAGCTRSSSSRARLVDPRMGRLFHPALQSQLSAPPVWYSMTRVSKKFFSFLRSIISDIQGKGLDAPENNRSSPIC